MKAINGNIALTCYLTNRIDPQRHVRWKTDDDAAVATWIRSLTRCGLRGVIFHDNLSEGFCERWASDNVAFQQVQWRTLWSAAEERVRIYRDWLRDNPCEWVLTTDLSDVEFYQNPFPLINDPAVLYIGSEPALIGRTILKKWMLRAYGEVLFGDRPVLNPGIVGGHGKTLLAFLNQWLDEMERAIQPTPPPHDIVAFNRLVYRENIPFVTGHPLHTVFRLNESSDKGAAIRHK